MASETDSTERLAVLLGTYNGNRFLGEQLASIAGQTHRYIDIWASDDGSTDDTVRTLRTVARHWRKGTFKVLHGPGEGFAENYRSMLTNPAINATYFAFCDQDDIWNNDKLGEAVAWLASQPAAHPAIYCSRAQIIDDAGRRLGNTRFFARPPSFRNAIVQSIAGGNTMVFNRAAREVLAEASRRAPFVSHDWWSYMIVTGVGGTVRYVEMPSIAYRQHDNNLVGANNTIAAQLVRLRHLLNGRFARWMSINIGGLTACSDLLTDDAREVLEQIKKARAPGPVGRVYHLFRSGAYRQSLRGTVGLYFAGALNKF